MKPFVPPAMAMRFRVFPMLGIKADWADRIKKGKDTLHKHAIEGFNTMPAKGGRGDLSDDEVKAAVDYMVNQSGGKF